MYVVKPEDGELPVRVGQRCAAVKPLCASREPLAGVVGSRQSDVDAEVSRLAEVIGASQVIHPTEPFGGVQTANGVSELDLIKAVISSQVTRRTEVEKSSSQVKLPSG